MSLLGLDVGTTGCKAAVFSLEGSLLGLAYEEYDIRRPRPGWAELDAAEVWAKVQRAVRAALSGDGARAARDPVKALAVSSMGEAVVPVSADRRILGPSILNMDRRGAEFLERLSETLAPEGLYRANGNTLGNHYTLTKLLWIREHEPELYGKTHRFLHWSGFVSFLLGAEARVDYSLANRTLLFDLDSGSWSQDLARRAGIPPDRLPDPVPSGTPIGALSASAAESLGLPRGIPIVSGSHDQCANALGCGAVEEGEAMLGMGTYLCLVPVFRSRPRAAHMISRGLNTEHHAAAGRFVSFLYNPGGALLKWYRDTFALRDKEAAARAGQDVYEVLLREIPEGPSGVLVLPHFAPCGPPEFVSDSSGVMTGLKLETTRGEILRGILEGALFYIRDLCDSLAGTGVAVRSLRAVGGGSKSDAWVRMACDILSLPMHRPRVAEAGCLGAAIMAGVGAGLFPSFEEAVGAMVAPGDSFDPDPAMGARYAERYGKYRMLWPLMRGFLTAAP